MLIVEFYSVGDSAEKLDPRLKNVIYLKKKYAFCERLKNG